jgi:GT2 family glycosyltransferase
MVNKSVNKIGIVIVAHNSAKELKKLLGSLEKQLLPKDKVIVVDNHPELNSAPVAKRFSIVNKTVLSDNNGFASGCNLGVKALNGGTDLIFFLNPDTRLAKDSLSKLRTNIPDSWSAWMGLLVKDDGLVNSAGNVVHLSGLSWCDGFNKNPSIYNTNKEVNILSGACLMVRTKVLKKLGGMPEDYFLYYEDTDISTRMQLRNMVMGLVPDAHVLHDYDFKKSNTKWFYIEKNRYLYIIQCWPLTVIILLLPYLIVCDIGLFIVSIFERRFLLKLHSLGSFLLSFPKAVKNRMVVQKSKKISSYQFLKNLSAKIDTEQLGNPKKFIILNFFSIIYKNICLALLFPFR